MIRTLLCSLMLVLFLTISGCARPKESQTYVVVDAGDPLQIVDTDEGKSEKVLVTGTTLKGGAIAKQDITGWITMPPSHWKVLSAQLEKDKLEGRLLTFPAK